MPRRKFSKGAAQAVDRIISMIPIPPLLRDNRSAVWRYLRPTPERRLTDVMLLRLNGDSEPGLRRKPFGLSVTDHALGRVLDRTAMSGDPAQAVIEAHDALLALEPAEGFRLFALPKFLLPTRDGAFLVSSCSTSDDTPMSIARSWIAHDQLHGDQERDVGAWAQLLDAYRLSELDLKGQDNVPIVSI